MNQQNENDKTEFKTPHSQGARRALFGSNVIISVAIAVSLTIGVNWIGRRAAKRIDLTRIRSYTLSEQTTQVLAELDQQMTIVTLFDDKGPMIDEARYLIDEYAMASDRIKVEHVRATDLASTRTFFLRMHDQFHDQLVVARDSITKVTNELNIHLTTIEGTNKDLQQILDAFSKSNTSTSQRWQGQLLNIRNSLDQTEDRLHEVIARVTEEMDHELPPYAPLLAMQRQLTMQSALQMAAFHRMFTQMGNMLVGGKELDTAHQELLLSLVDRFQVREQKLKLAMGDLNKVSVPSDYQRLRFHLKHSRSSNNKSGNKSRNPLVIIGRDRMVPMTLEEDLFLELPGKRGAQMRIRHQGEERITSMLAAMDIEQMPLVVFAFPQMPQLDKESKLPVTFGYAIKALQRRGFEVKMHTPVKMTREGQQVQQKIPQPAEGQRAVWLFVPPPPDKPMTPQQIMAIARGQKSMAELLKKRIEKGDSAMVLVSPTPSATYRVDNPILPILSSFGVDVISDEMIIHEVQTATDQSRASLVHEVSEWPQDSPIGRALNGLPAAFLGPAPMDLDKSKISDYQVIARIDGRERWSDKNFIARKFDPQKSREYFNVAVAISDDRHRLIVATGQQWLHDNLAAAGEVNGRLIRGAAYTHGAKYPGNTDLFVNSILWLSYQDKLILPAARSQDIARIQPMAFSTQKDLRLAVLILVPLIFMVSGAAVYYMRRRG